MSPEKYRASEMAAAGVKVSTVPVLAGAPLDRKFHRANPVQFLERLAIVIQGHWASTA
jgi:hypothetical protein